MAGETVLDLDLETGTWSKWPALQGGSNIASQFQIVTTPIISGWGAYTGRLKCGSTDVWQDGSYRALACNYGTGEHLGQEYWYAFAMYSDTVIPSGTLLWELHHENALSTANNYIRSLAPHALHSRSGGLYWRLVGGYSTANAGYPYWEPNIQIPGLTPQPTGEWIWFKVNIKFQEMNAYDGNNAGYVNVYWRTATDTTYWSTPALTRTNVSTLPYNNDLNLHDRPLYLCIGVYPGTNQPASDIVVYHTGVRRRLTQASAEAAFTQYTSQPDPPSSDPHIGQWQTTPAVLAAQDDTPPIVFPDQFVGDWVQTTGVDATQVLTAAGEYNTGRFRDRRRGRRGHAFFRG